MVLVTAHFDSGTKLDMPNLDDKLKRIEHKPNIRQNRLIELTSERFSLSPLGPADLDVLHHLWTHEQVRKFIWDNKVVPMELTEEILQKNDRLFQDSGFGIFGIREHGSSELIGFTGFWYFRTQPTLELLFGVAPDYWNRGVAAEASFVIIRYGFEVLGFDRIEASSDSANTASIRVFEKLSMTFERRATVDGLDTVFYSLRRTDERGSHSS
jgi:[ribosomal protein S5]-alanine N-acetyltransferase